MKKLILITLAICATLIAINQLLNNKYSKKTIGNTIQTKIAATLNQDDVKIEKLNQEYNFRTKQLNQEMKNNLVASITLINNQITINYQTLNRKLYSNEVYQMIIKQAIFRKFKSSTTI